jgi:predicted DNA-binding protein
MGMDAFVQARVSIATKERIRALAQRQGLAESTIVKQLLERMLVETVGPDLSDDARPLRGLRDRRLYVRLREDDWVLLVERSRRRQLRPATYVSVLVRSHLRSLAPLPREELLALKITIAELGAVGRNLNQIARALNQGYVEVPKWEEFRAMLKICEALRDRTRALLMANLKSWNQGYQDELK